MSSAVPAAMPGRSSVVYRIAFAIILSLQIFLAFLGSNEPFKRGHNGWNGGAYLLSARNSLRWNILFPLQYDTSTTAPAPDAVYTHHPLAMHLHHVASVWLFGDSEASLRVVAALFAVLAAAMLMIFVRRFWGEPHAILTGAIWVVFPINGIYLNMANHTTGCLTFSLITLYFYLRHQEERDLAADGSTAMSSRVAWRTYLGTLGFFVVAGFWDWPAYYLAAVMAIHWLYAIVRRARRGPFPLFGADFARLAGFCVVVLATFASHFLIVHLVTGGLSELRGTFSARQDLSWSRFSEHLRVVPELMLTWPVMILSALWLVTYFVRLARGRAERRDLFPVAYAIAGTLHYFLFKWSAILHEYWAWTGTPFLAFATASMVLSLGAFLRDAVARRMPEGRTKLAPLLAASLTGVLLLPLAVRAIDLVPKGRRVGGSLWFVAPTRGPEIAEYHPGFPELRFAKQVRAWTDRSTGVLVHRGIERLVPEPRFYSTMDRETRHVASIPRRPTPATETIRGWVLIGRIEDFRSDELAQLAARHPYRQYDAFFMADLRTEGEAIEVWTLATEPMTAWYWFWESQFEPPKRAARAPDLEARLREQVASLAR